MSRISTFVLATFALGFLGGCGGSGGSGGSGGMNVHLVDGPVNGFLEVNVHIRSVEIRGDGGWRTLGTPDRTVNLLALVGGVSESLASGATLPEGSYGQMRLVLGEGNTVQLADGTVVPLKVPSGLQSGIKLVVNFKVEAGTTKDVWIDFDAAHSIQLVGAGASGQYILRPTVWAYDKVATGSISGTLTDMALNPQGLGGVEVMAEVIDGAGNPVVARRTLTAPGGAYTLDLLPVGYTYHVVSLPRSATSVYQARASQGFALTAATPTFTYSASFAFATETGAVAGTLTPTASSTQSDQVDLLQPLATGAGSQTFVVDTTLATVGSTETYGFSLVPPGTYGLRAIRFTDNGDGTRSSAPAVYAAPFTVGMAVTTTVDLGL